MAFSGTSRVEIEGHSYPTDEDRPNTNFEQVTDGYFSVLDAKILEGRDFALDDRDAKLPVAIVNSAFARKHFGRESAVGRRFRTVGNNGQLFGPWRTIVGVVPTVRMLGPFNNPQVDETGFYLPYYSAVLGPPLPGPVRQQFATVLEEAGREGAVRIQRKDGQVFVVRPERTKASPLDVPGLNLHLTRKEIVEYVRAGRRPATGANPPSRRASRKPRRATS